MNKDITTPRPCRVVTYDAAGDIVTDYTSPPMFDVASPQQYATNALHHPAAAQVKVWEANADLAGEPILTVGA